MGNHAGEVGADEMKQVDIRPGDTADRDEKRDALIAASLKAGKKP